MVRRGENPEIRAAAEGVPATASNALPAVLVVTCERDGGDLYCTMLETGRLGRGVWASSLRSALRRLGETPACAAVIYDVMRPSDWTDCETLARHDGVPPIIVISGWIMPDRRFRTRAFDAGCAAFVAKPCSVEMLGAVLSRALAGERRIECLK